MPSRGDFGTPGATPTIERPNRGDYGLGERDTALARKGVVQSAAEARKAAFGFRNPTETGAFKRLMGLANETTAAQAGERSRQAKDAAQRRGYAGGFEDTERQSQADQMTALATAGFAGAEAVQEQFGEQYGRAIGAFASLQEGYNNAMVTGNTTYAKDLTETRIQQVQAQLGTMQLNQQQQIEYGRALNEARQAQAALDEQFNKDQIDNHRYIQANQQIAAQLAASMAALNQRSHEFDVTSAFEKQKFEEGRREFDLTLKANPGTATRVFDDPRYGGGARSGPGPVRPGGALSRLS